MEKQINGTQIQRESQRAKETERQSDGKIEKSDTEIQMQKGRIKE